jgi:uncharacterized RDD family membrane protein YckC
MNQPLDVLKIDTPENVTFSYEVSGIGSRFLAALVDTSLLVLLQVIVLGTVLLILSQLGSANSNNPLADFSGQAGGWIFAILAFVSFLFFWGYYIFFETLWNGQTPGKRWIGLRVIRLDGTPVGVSEVVIRNLVRTLDLLPIAYGLGVITMFVNSNSRRLGDLAAGTVVVRDSRATLGRAPVRIQDELSLLYGHGQLPANFPLEKISDQDMQVLESFFSRRGELANRTQLALYLLQSLYGRLGLAATESAFEADPEHALAAIYQARQRLKAGGSEIK